MPRADKFLRSSLFSVEVEYQYVMLVLYLRSIKHNADAEEWFLLDWRMGRSC